MKLSDIVDLAKAGYKPADIFKLLEYVETSTAVQEAAPIQPDEKLPTPEELPKDEPLIKKEEVKSDAQKTTEDIMKGLLN